MGVHCPYEPRLVIGWPWSKERWVVFFEPHALNLTLTLTLMLTQKPNPNPNPNPKLNPANQCPKLTLSGIGNKRSLRNFPLARPPHPAWRRPGLTWRWDGH